MSKQPRTEKPGTVLSGSRRTDGMFWTAVVGFGGKLVGRVWYRNASERPSHERAAERTALAFR